MKNNRWNRKIFCQIPIRNDFQNVCDFGILNDAMKFIEAKDYEYGTIINIDNQDWKVVHAYWLLPIDRDEEDLTWGITE